MKLLVMGAGYVGMALLRYFQNQDEEIYVTTTQANKVESLKPYAKEVLLLNSTDDKGLSEMITICDEMIVLVAPKNKENYEETYLKTAKIISKILAGRKKPFYLLYTSSTSVYEGIGTEWATEDLVLTPESKNGRLLLEAETIFLKCANTCILRLGGIYGPDREIAKRALSLSGKEMPGSGEEPTNHIHLDDIVAAIVFCLKHQLTGIYNLVNDEHPSRKELYSTLCQSMSLPSPHWNPLLSSGRKGYKVSNRKIIEAGFAVKKN